MDTITAMSAIDSDIFRLVVIPLLIIVARIFDVSLQTMRIIYVSKGRKLLAPLLGFFEVLIWLIAITQIMKNLNTPFYYIVYSAGFAAGTYVGLRIEEKLAVGTVLFRVITQLEAAELIARLRAEAFGVTCIDGEGISGKVKIIFLVVDRSDLPRVIGIIRKDNPTAFYSVEDIRTVSKGFFRVKRHQRLLLSRK